MHSSIETWLNDLHHRGKSRATIAAYRRGLAHFARWVQQSSGQNFDPAAIIPRDLTDWQAFQQTVEKATPNTINLRLGAVRRYFTWAVRQGLARTNPAEEVTTLRPTRRQPKALDEKELRRLLRQVHKAANLRDIALVELLLGTGLRVSETLALRLADLSLSERSGQVVVRRGKAAVHRTVPLTAPVRKALQAYLDSPAFQTYRAAHPDLGDDLPLWVGERGPLRDRSGVFYLLRKYARQAGLEADRLSPHVLRHTFATRYLAAHPGDLRGLADILGHAGLDTVMIYTTPTTDDLATRMEQAEQFRGFDPTR